MKITIQYVIIAGLIVYISLFTNPPPRFVSLVLSSPVGQVLALLAVVAVFMKNQPIGLLCGVAYLVSTNPVLEHLDPKEQAPTKEQPKSGAPKPDTAQIGKLASLISGKGGKLPQKKGKDETKPPTPTTSVKPHSDPKVTEKFSMF